MTDNNGKQPHEMSKLGTFIIGIALGAMLWCGSHLDGEHVFLWLVGALACVFIIVIVAALEDYFNWEFDDDEEEE